MRPVGNGRDAVRFMSLSDSRSQNMFNAFAEPTESAVPIKVRSTCFNDKRSGAIAAPPKVINKQKSVIRGLVSCT